MKRYERQIMLPDIGTEGQTKIRNASVLLVGVGGLGSAISTYLTAAGIGNLGIIDADILEEHNLPRQVLYSQDKVGLPKVLAAEERLKSLNSEVSIKCYPEFIDETNTDKIISQYDVVVDGTDNYTARMFVNDACVEKNKPFVYGAVKEYEGQVAVFNYRGSKNYRDVFGDTMPQKKVYGLFGMLPSIIGSVQANETIKIITGIGEVLANKLWVINTLNMKTNIFSF